VLTAFAAPLLVTSKAQRPNVESISSGFCEKASAKKALRLIDSLFEFDAAAEFSVVSSAGDTGSSGCALNGNASALSVKRAQFPVSSPYVTGVGGTKRHADGGQRARPR